MSMESFRKLLAVSKVQFQLVIAANFFLCILLALSAPLIFGIANLDEIASSYVLERYIALSGTLLFTPLFFPEQNPNVRELTESKRTGFSYALILRVLQSILMLLLLTSAFLGAMAACGCEFHPGKMLFGTFSSALFLGALGFTTCAFTGNLVAGYLVSAGYFMLNFFAGDKLGKLYLFSLSLDSFEEKYWLLTASTLLFACSFGWRYFVLKKR